MLSSVILVVECDKSRMFVDLCARGGCWVSFVCQCDGNLKWHWNSSSLSDAHTTPGSPGDPCTPDMKHVFCRRGIPIRENASRYYIQVKGSFAVTRLKTAVGFKQYISSLSVHNAPFLLFSLYTTFESLGSVCFLKRCIKFIFYKKI